MKTLIHTLAQSGIEEWMSCEGSQASPLSDALRSCGAFRFWDSGAPALMAAFALGRCQASGRPVGVLIQGQSDIDSLRPTVEAAYHQARPLVIVSTDVCSSSLSGMAQELELSFPCSLQDLSTLQELIKKSSPVHIRLQGSATLTGSLDEITLGDAPSAPAFRSSLVAISQLLRFKAQEGLALIIGALDPDEQEPVLWLAQTLRVPVLAEASSGLREQLQGMNLCLGDEILSRYCPPHILRVGAVPTGSFWKSLEQRPETKVYSITRSGFAGLQRQSVLVQGELEQIMKAIGDIPHQMPDRQIKSMSRQNAAKIEELLLRYPESEAALIHAFSLQSCMSDGILIAGEKSCQLWNQFAQRSIPTPYLRDLNQGDSSCMATFLGNSVDWSQAVCFSDVASLIPDAEAASLLPLLPPSQRLLCVLPDAEVGIDLRQLAATWGARYHAIDCEADFDVLEDWEEDEFIILELRPDPEQSQALRAKLA